LYFSFIETSAAVNRIPATDPINYFTLVAQALHQQHPQISTTDIRLRQCMLFHAGPTLPSHLESNYKKSLQG